MRAFSCALVVLAAAAVSACSSISVATDHDESADFTKFRTYAWMPAAPDQPPPFAGNTMVEKRVTAAIERELGVRGIQRDDASPSFLIAMHTLSRDVLNITTWPSWGYGWHDHHAGGWDDHVEVNQYTEGTLVLDFVRPGGDGLLWRGIARTVVDEHTGSPEFVNEVVGKLLADFPPGYAAK